MTSRHSAGRRCLVLACGLALAAGPLAAGPFGVARAAAGPVALAAAPGTPLDDAARQLAAHDIADSVAHGQQALVLVGSAPLATRRHAPAALFVQLQSAPLCGSAGCETSVFLPAGGDWRRVLDSVSGPITVLPTSHGHMHDLRVGANDRWVWAGHAYRDTIAAPALVGLKRSVERHQAAVARGQAPQP